MRNAILFAVLFLATAAAAQEGIRPRVVVTWETRDAGEVSTSSLRQDIDLFLSRAITETIGMRMNVGVNHNRLAIDVIDAPVQESRAFELRPSGVITASFGRVHTETDYLLRRSRTQARGRTNERHDDQIGTNINWQSTRFLPGGTIRATRYSLADRAASADIVNDAMYATLNYSFGPIGIAAGQSYRTDRDSRGDYERTTIDRTASLNFADSYFGGRLAVSAGASGSLSRIDDNAGRVSRIPTFVPPARALWGVDDTPHDSADHPLSAYPTLIDGRTSVSTGINLGPDGASFQAIGFDIGRVSPVDELQIVVRDERNDPVRLADGIQWDVYTSLDGIHWTPHTIELAITFDSVRSLYRIAFQQLDVRWIKVVTFGTAAQQVFVTEGYVLFHTTREIGGEDSDFRSIASSASLTFLPWRGVTLAYTGTGYDSSQQAGEAVLADVRDISHLLSARFDPSARFGYEIRYELQDATTDRVDRRTRWILGSMRFTPRPQFSAMLSCDVRTETFDHTPLDARACSAQLNARIFPTLELSGGATHREQTIEQGGSLMTRTAFASASARVTPNLRLTLTASANRSTFDEWTGIAQPPRSDDRITADVDWVRGRALSLGGTFGWAHGDGFSGIVQRYRVRWSPFGDGTVSLTTNYTEDIDPYSSSRSRRVLVSPRWQVNPRTALGLTWSSIKTTGEQTFESESILAALMFGR